jgi:very-short-patch-repair endonuclease/predicted transcriptional regulator of viral defense system
MDRDIAALAASQFGVVARAQLRGLGLTDSAIARRVAAGRLHRVRRAVYAVGHPALGGDARWLAAVLACGSGAVLSHSSAAALWGLRPSAAASIDVTVRGASRRRGPNLRVHRSPLGAGDVTTERGIPVTSPARTILDLAGVLRDARALERVLDRAEILRLTDVRQLDEVSADRRAHRGASRLQRALAMHTPGTTLTRSELEERILALCRERGLPRPRVNDFVAGLEVDFLFAERCVVVEADSWTYHRSRTAFERDRERDATLALAGYRVLRFTHRQMTNEPATVAAAISAALDAPTPGCGPAPPARARGPRPRSSDGGAARAG